MGRVMAKKSLVMLLALIAMSFSLRAADSDFETLKKEIEELKKDNADIKKTNAELASKIKPAASNTEKALDAKYGPNATVVTKTGKLKISGLLQVWYYTYQKDNNALFQDAAGNGIFDTNEASMNSGTRIRRTELKFTMDLTDNITSVVMIDPAREAQSFPGMPDNQVTQSIFKRGLNANLANVQGGVGSAPRLLQDAYINYHNFVPHHDFQLGQFKPFIGEEGIRGSSELDFVERSFVGQLADNRDLGIVAHGEWWHADGKGGGQIQYWLGAFDNAGNYYQSGGQAQNRADDNDEKDFNYRILVRPFWKQDSCDKWWGSLELGFSGEFGRHGQAGGPDPVDAPVNGLNRRRVWASRQDAWGYYAPAGPVSGLWFRGEWEWQKDKNAPSAVIDLLGQGNAGDGSTQTNGKPFASQGFYVSTGYKLSQSKLFSCECPAWYKQLEFVARYEQYQNVEIADPANPSRTNAFYTKVATGGVNYYIQGNTKIMVNYSSIRNPEGGSSAPYVFHNTKDNAFVVNFQVAF